MKPFCGKKKKKKQIIDMIRVGGAVLRSRLFFFLFFERGDFVGIQERDLD